MHLKTKPNPDMVFTGQPELLARLVWDGDFRDSSWLSYKNASWSWATALSGALLCVLKCRCYCWKKKPHWWHLVFSQITVEKISLKGTQEAYPPTGGPGRRAPAGEAAVYGHGLAFPQLRPWRIVDKTTLLPSCQQGRRPNLREFTYADRAQSATNYRLCHFPSSLVTNSSRGCLCKAVYLHKKQITALDTVTCNFQVDYVCCKPVTASDNKNHCRCKKWFLLIFSRKNGLLTVDVQ